MKDFCIAIYVIIVFYGLFHLFSLSSVYMEIASIEQQYFDQYFCQQKTGQSGKRIRILGISFPFIFILNKKKIKEELL